MDPVSCRDGRLPIDLCGLGSPAWVYGPASLGTRTMKIDRGLSVARRPSGLHIVRLQDRVALLDVSAYVG